MKSFLQFLKEKNEDSYKFRSDIEVYSKSKDEDIDKIAVHILSADNKNKIYTLDQFYYFPNKEDEKNKITLNVKPFQVNRDNLNNFYSKGYGYNRILKYFRLKYNNFKEELDTNEEFDINEINNNETLKEIRLKIKNKNKKEEEQEYKKQWKIKEKNISDAVKHIIENKLFIYDKQINSELYDVRTTTGGGMESDITITEKESNNSFCIEAKLNPTTSSFFKFSCNVVNGNFIYSPTGDNEKIFSTEISKNVEQKINLGQIITDILKEVETNTIEQFLGQMKTLFMGYNDIVDHSKKLSTKIGLKKIDTSEKSILSYSYPEKLEDLLKKFDRYFIFCRSVLKKASKIKNDNTISNKQRNDIMSLKDKVQRNVYLCIHRDISKNNDYQITQKMKDEITIDFIDDVLNTPNDDRLVYYYNLLISPVRNKHTKDEKYTLKLINVKTSVEKSPSIQKLLDAIEKYYVSKKCSYIEIGNSKKATDIDNNFLLYFKDAVYKDPFHLTVGKNAIKDFGETKWSNVEIDVTLHDLKTFKLQIFLDYNGIPTAESFEQMAKSKKKINLKNDLFKSNNPKKINSKKKLIKK